MCCTRRRHATDRMCAFDTATSQHAADEDNRHATLARTQLTATKARTQGSVDIRRRHANRPLRDPRTARACQRALQSPRSSPTKARVVKTEKRTADERATALPCARASSIFRWQIRTSAAHVSERYISENWASHPRRGSPSPTGRRWTSGGEGGERQLKKNTRFLVITLLSRKVG